jgi:hypothetical protein
VTKPTVTAEVHEVLDVALHLAAELTHHGVVLLDVITDLADLVIGEVADSAARVKAEALDDLA